MIERQLLIVCGVARSGTTALARVLNAHPLVCIGLERYKFHCYHGGFEPNLFDKSRFCAHAYGHIVREFPACEVVPATEPREVAAFLDQEKIAVSAALMPPRIACSASHFRVWKEVIARELPCAIVFEDDVAIRKGFKGFVRKLKAQLPSHFDLVHLYISAPRTKWKKRAAVTDRAYVSYVPKFGRSAYLVSRLGAQKLVAGFQTIVTNGDIQISQMAQDGTLSVYCASKEYVENLGQLRFQFKGEKFRSTLREREPPSAAV